MLVVPGMTTSETKRGKDRESLVGTSKNKLERQGRRMDGGLQQGFTVGSPQKRKNGGKEDPLKFPRKFTGEKRHGKKG